MWCQEIVAKVVCFLSSQKGKNIVLQLWASSASLFLALVTQGLWLPWGLPEAVLASADTLTGRIFTGGFLLFLSTALYFSASTVVGLMPMAFIDRRVLEQKHQKTGFEWEGASPRIIRLTNALVPTLVPLLEVSFPENSVVQAAVLAIVVYVFPAYTGWVFG